MPWSGNGGILTSLGAFLTRLGQLGLDLGQLPLQLEAFPQQAGLLLPHGLGIPGETFRLSLATGQLCSKGILSTFGSGQPRAETVQLLLPCALLILVDL